MKNEIKFVLLFAFLIFFPFVSADLISINSGGNLDFIINPGGFIENFFLSGNRFPIVSNVVLNSSGGLNTSGENLSVFYNSYDLDNNQITNITDWRKNSSSIAVLNLPFDKRVFTTSSGAVRDYSTYENNGTLGGGNPSYSPTWISDCQVGGCYKFDGVDDYIVVGNSSSLNPGTNNFTIGMWIKVIEKISGNEGIFTKGYVQAYGVYYVSGFDRVGLYIQSGSDNNGINISSYYNQWIYVAWTVDNSNDIQRSYLNGDFVIQTNNPVGNVFSSYDINIGRYSSLSNYYFNGSIDEIMVFDYMLSPEQIQELYQSGLANHGLEKIVSQETSPGDLWQVALTPNDVFDDGLTVLSNNLFVGSATPYNSTNVSLSSLNERNESDTDLRCSAFISDSDSSTLTVYVDWIKDSVSQFTQEFPDESNGTTFITDLNSDNLTLGEIWMCSVRTYDGNSYSNWENSNELEIIDITSPNVTIISPNETEYSILEIDFNISINENENISFCFYSLNNELNISMTEINDSYWFSEPEGLTAGSYNLTFSCNDTSGNWGFNSTNFTILDEAAIAIDLSPALDWNVNWTLSYLPVNDLGAEGNNGDDMTLYYINISTTDITADIYVRADGDLHTLDGDILGLGNETFVVNETNSSVPDFNRLNMSTDYTLIGSDLGNGTVIYLKFYLDAPISQAAGSYFNALEFKAVHHGAVL